MTLLDKSGIALLSYLIRKLESAVPGNPQTYISYKDAHDEMGLKLYGTTYGESLKHQGLTNLANWSSTAGVPGVTGLIIDRASSMPGDGYFRLFNKSIEDFEWWKQQIIQSKEFDWSKFVPVKIDEELKGGFENWLLRIGKSPRSAKSYSGAISGVMSDWAKEANLIKDSLLDITTPKALANISEKLPQVDIFIARNTKGNGMYSSALKAYAEYLSDTSNEEIQDDVEEIIHNTEIPDTEKSTLINARVGQGKFRKGLIEFWNGCAVTGFADTRFLVASHIKPWRKSNNRQRLDAFNGLLLLPNIDKAFDLGYVSFKQQGKIMLSPELECADVLGIHASMSVRLDDAHQEYMAFHRNQVFKK